MTLKHIKMQYVLHKIQHREAGKGDHSRRDNEDLTITDCYLQQKTVRDMSGQTNDYN